MDCFTTPGTKEARIWVIQESKYEAGNTQGTKICLTCAVVLLSTARASSLAW